jgi:hypothetical protein
MRVRVSMGMRRKEIMRRMVELVGDDGMFIFKTMVIDCI